MSVVMPGAVGTNITANAGVDIPVADPEAAAAEHRVTSPEDTANIILDGVEKDDLHVYVGRDARDDEPVESGGVPPLHTPHLWADEGPARDLTLLSGISRRPSQLE